MDATTEFLPRASTGVAGLDQVLDGGWARTRMHLLEGSPGTGKTTIALQFLLAGAKAGETGIYISLAETEQELRDGARSHGWEIDPSIEIFELVPPDSVLNPDQHQSLLYSSDLELGEAITRVFESIERVKPQRVVIDSLSEIRLLAQSSLRYRRQILALKYYFAKHNTTVVMLDDLTGETNDRAVHSIAHSVTQLEQLAPVYGAERRRMRVAKCRGQSFRGGFHDFVIGAGGIQVFPRLVAADLRKGFSGDLVKSGLPALDKLVGNGLPARRLHRGDDARGRSDRRERVEERIGKKQRGRRSAPLHEPRDLRIGEARAAHHERFGLAPRIEERGEEMRPVEDGCAASPALGAARDELRHRLEGRIVARCDRLHRNGSSTWRQSATGSKLRRWISHGPSARSAARCSGVA